MCLIIHRKQGKKLDESVYRNAWDNNEDGAGIAYLDHDVNEPSFKVLRISKGFMTYDRLINKIKSLGDCEMLIHFRRASPTMVVNEAMTHPFYVDTQDTVYEMPCVDKDGKELFYTAGPGIIGSVSVTTKPSLSFGSPVRAPKSGFTTGSPAAVRTFDILPDGKHFIGVAPAGQTQTGGGPAQIQVVLNWFEDVKQRAPVR